MTLKRILTVTLLVFVAASAGFLIYKETGPGQKGNSSPATGEPQKIDNALIVYFFHGAARCRSCKIIEANALEAIEKGFPDQVKSGKIVWRDINLDEKENKHFSQDYEIISISLVLVEMEDGKQKRWKNLEKVWDLLDDKKEFIEYVRGEVRAYQ